MESRDEVEVKLAWLEKYVLELDGVVRSLADEVATLRGELATVRAAQAAGREPGGESEGMDLLYERPPHY